MLIILVNSGVLTGLTIKFVLLTQLADKAYITPNVLKWARESVRMTEEFVAIKVSVSVEKLKEWEAGTSQPTIRQAQKLAKLYKRPFALFFLPDIPRDFQLLQDFRKSGSKILTTSSIFIIREIQQKQVWISDIFSDNQEGKLPFVGRFSINNSPQEVASHREAATPCFVNQMYFVIGKIFVDVGF